MRLRDPAPILLPRLGLVLLLLTSAALHIHAVARDTVPMAADPSGYYRTSLHLYRSIARGNGATVVRRLFRPGIRPPLPQLVTTAAFLATGDCSQRMARHSVLVFHLLLLLSVYGIGARLGGRGAGLAAAALLAAFPQVVGYSRLYWMDLPLAALTAASIWALLATDGLRRRGPAALFGLVLGLGMLTKYTLPVFLVGPVAVVLASSLNRLRRSHISRAVRRLQVRRTLEGMALAALVCAATCGPWYAVTIGAAWRNFIFNQGVGVLPARRWLTVHNLTLYARHLYEVQLGPLSTVLFLLALPVLWRRCRPATRWLLLSWIALPYLFFTFLVLGIEWARFTLPYLPAVALAIALALLRFRFHLLMRAAVVGACLAGLLLAGARTFHPPAPLAPGTVAWRRGRLAGMLQPASYDYHVNVRQLLRPPRPGAWVHVAVAPDAANLASVFETWSFQQEASTRFSVPYEPEGNSFAGRFTYPERVGDERYLLRFDYVLWIVPPPRMVLRMRRPALWKRFEQTWHRVQPRFRLTDDQRLPGGFRVLIYQRRRLTGSRAGVAPRGGARSDQRRSATTWARARHRPALSASHS